MRSVEYAQGNTLDGRRSMECTPWKRWNAHEGTRNEIRIVKSARWNPHNGVCTMDPHNKIRRKIESAQENSHNGIRTRESA